MGIYNDCFTLSTKYEFMLIFEREMEEKEIVRVVYCYLIFISSPVLEAS